MFPLPRLSTPIIPKSDQKSEIAFPEVYPPSEDTFLFLDCLTSEIEDIVLEKPQFILEMGSGTGCIITYLMKLIESSNHCKSEKERLMPFYFSVDINPNAVLQTMRTVQSNCPMNRLDGIRTSLFQNICNRAVFDLILFNPPYVESEVTSLEKSDIVASWAGGLQGKMIIDQFLKSFEHHISSRGILYILMEKSNNMIDIVSGLVNRGFTCKELISRKIIGENLSIWRIWNDSNHSQ